MPLDSAPLRERLGDSSQALLAPHPSDGAATGRPSSQGQVSTPSARPAPFPWEDLARHLGRRWWQRHPANAAAQLARPALARYATAHPATLMAGAATVGAIAMLVKPWRLLSASAVAAALFKSSDVADWVTLLASPDKDKGDTFAPRKDRR